MPELQDIFKQFGDEYRNTHNIHIDGLKAMDSIASCRTAALGGHVDVCDDCGCYSISYNSCGNRKGFSCMCYLPGFRG